MNLVHSNLSMKYYIQLARIKEKDDVRILGKRMPRSMHVCQVCGCVCGLSCKAAILWLSIGSFFFNSVRGGIYSWIQHPLVKILRLWVASYTNASLAVPLAACFLRDVCGRPVAKVWILASCFGNISWLSLVILVALLAILPARYTLTWQVDAFHLVLCPASLVGAKLFLRPSWHITHFCRALATSQFLVGFLPRVYGILWVTYVFL